MRSNAVKAACFAWLAAGLWACGSDNQPLQIQNSKATGSVGGIVLNAATRAPLAGAQVVLVAGGVAAPAATTDATGAFSFTNVSAGEVAVTISLDGYLSAMLHGTLQGAQEFPVDNTVLTFGPIGLVPSTGSFQALVQFDDGSPASGLQLTARTGLRFYDLGDGASADNAAAQVTTVNATTDGTGLVQFTGLPDFAALGEATQDLVTVIVPPVAGQTGDPALYKYPGGSFPYHMLALGAYTPVIVLRQTMPANLAVVAASIPALESGAANAVPGIVDRGGPIWVTFNLPLDPYNTTIKVLDETGAALNSQPTMAITYDTLQLTFTPALPDGSAQYYLVIHAVAAAGDHLLRGDFWAPFYTPVPAQMMAPSLTRDTTETDWIHVTFREPVGGIGGTLWGADCVIFYNINLNSGNSAIGDDPGETGNPNCIPGNALYSEETDPTGIVGVTGYSRKWKFQLPFIGVGILVPAGTPIQFVFSRVSNGVNIMKRVNGQVVPDQALIVPQ
jgi:hypothetical protein